MIFTTSFVNVDRIKVPGRSVIGSEWVSYLEYDVGQHS